MLYGAVTISYTKSQRLFMQCVRKDGTKSGASQVSAPLQRGLMFIQQRGLMFIYEYKATGVSYFLLSLP